MTTMIRYQPQGLNWALHRELLNEFNRFVAGSDSGTNNDASNAATAEWSPAVDIEEYADRFVLHADVPGIDPASIELTLEKGVLTLSGSRERSVETTAGERRRLERATGRFHRRFSLPDTIDSDAVSARGNNGVLEIVIPKRPSTQPRRIAVAH